MSKLKRYIYITVFTVAVLLLLAVGFHFDNKYTSFVPEKQGSWVCLGEELSRFPVFLVDHWQMADGVHAPGSEAEFQPTWVGEYSNYRRGSDRRQSPYGSRTYRYAFRYDGKDLTAAVLLPALADRYVLWLDDTLLGEGWGRAQESFSLTAGEHTLTLVVVSASGYYSGMYFPGALGSAKVIGRLVGMQSTIYGVAALIPLVLALFCFSLWAKSRDKMRLHFALFCISYALSLSHWFGQFINGPAAVYRFLASDLFTYAMFFFALCLMREVQPDPCSGVVCGAVAAIAAVELVLYLLFPVWPDGIWLHGMVQNVFRILLAGWLVFGAFRAVGRTGAFGGLVACSCGLLGVSLLVNLLYSNRFEPAYTLWQYEWCGFVQVLLFAWLMERHNSRLLEENRAYQTHLETMVEQRTAQLSAILDERRAFFSDMAHDLKAPVAALKAFIEMIRKNDIGLDNELLYYIEQVEYQQREISRRVGSLNELNAVDRLSSQAEVIAVAELLQGFYAIYNPEAAVNGIHLVVVPPKEPLFVRVQRQKMLHVFENLFFNALKFTPEGGTIALRAQRAAEGVCICVTDTGCGIPPEELPRIFDRFYMGETGEAKGGSGLGLYIVKSIMVEHGGCVEVSSTVGEGSEFRLWLPEEPAAVQQG